MSDYDRLAGNEETNLNGLMDYPMSMWLPSLNDDFMTRWQPGFHDNFFLGWLITISYFVSALLAAFLATFFNQMEERRANRFWLLICLVMTLLGFNKQFALQMLLTEIGRQIANTQGWYEFRRPIQVLFIITFTTVFTSWFIWYARRYHDFVKRYTLAFCGLFFLLSFVIIRAAGFHHFDVIIQYDLHGFKLSWMLELTGIYMILLAGVKEIVILTRRR